MRGLWLGSWLVCGACDPTFRQIPPDGSTSLPITSNPGTTGDQWYCDRQSVDGTCVAYTGDGWDAPSRDANCETGVQAGSCPVSDLGGCTLGLQTPLEFVEWYYTGAYYAAADLASLEGSCDANFGAWSGSGGT